MRIPILFLLLCAFCGSLFAQDNIKVFLDSVELENVQAREIDGNIMLPAKEVFEAVGMENVLRHNIPNYQCLIVAHSLQTIDFIIGMPFMGVDYILYSSTNAKQWVKLEVEPKMADNVFYVSLDVAIGEVIGYKAEWKSEENSIFLTRCEAKSYFTVTGKRTDKENNQDDIKVFLYGEEFENVQAKVIDGNVMLPAKEIFEALGAKFTVSTSEYGKELLFAEIFNKVIILTVGSREMVYDTDMTMSHSASIHRITLNVEPRRVDDTYFVPLDCIVEEIFKITTVWNSEKNRVDIGYISTV